MRVEVFRRRLDRHPNSREMDEVNKTLDRMIRRFMSQITGDVVEDNDARLGLNERLSFFIEMLLEKRTEDVKGELKRRRTK